MDSFIKKIDSAIASRDFMTLASVVSSHSSNSAWNTIGGGEQRSVAAYLIKMLVSNAAVVIPGAFQCYPCLRAVESVLLGNNCLPTSPIENAADNKLRKLLFDYYVQQLDFMGAAKILASTRMCDDDPKSIYYFSPADKCDLYITIAECCLQEGGDTVQADVFVTKAGAIVQQDLSFSSSTNGASISSEHRSLLLRYKYTYARILDANRKFLQAASRYYELSQLHDSEVEEEELILLLGRAATCAILSPTGTQKQRILGLLYKDPRLSTLDAMEKFSTHSIIVRKMYTNQILFLKGPQELCANDDKQSVTFSSRSAIIATFQESLAENHQQALTADGTASIVDRAFMEHNILAVSKLYTNIYISELSCILGMENDPWMTEKLVSMMIVEGRLNASIDQVDGLLTFGITKGNAAGCELSSWDDAITNFCIKLNKISEDISHQYGAFQEDEVAN